MLFEPICGMPGEIGSELDPAIHCSSFKGRALYEKEKPDRNCKRDCLPRKKGDG
jgi:hypothetical protein